MEADWISDATSGGVRRRQSQWRFVTTDADGSLYEGERRDSERHGRGRITAASCNRYEGERRKDKFDGQGTYTCQSGTRYEEKWRDGKPNGWGKAIYAWDGSVYEGTLDQRMFLQGNRRWALLAAREGCAFNKLGA